MAFGERLKEARLMRGYTQKQLAEKLGIAGTTITGYEKNNSEPSMLIISKIMSILDIDANFLFQDEARCFTLKASEFNLIKKYRTLDEYGKKAVDAVLDIEYERCQQSSGNLLVAARHGQRVKANHVDNLDELIPSKDTNNI